MRSRSFLRHSRFDEIARLMVWKALGTKGLHLIRKGPLTETPDVSRACFIFLGGLHRSGTSLVHRILRGVDGVTGFEHTGVPEDEGQHLQTVVPSARELGGPGQFAFDPRAHLTEVDAEALGARANTLLREWCAYLDLSKPFAVEKSPPNLTRSRFLQALFPNSAFVFITRHPVPVALATTAKWRVDLKTAFDHWGVAHAIMLEDHLHLKRVRTLRYDDFVADPRVCLSPVFSGIGLDAEPALEPVADADAAYFERWDRLDQPVRDGISRLMADRHGEVLDRLGYRLP